MTDTRTKRERIQAAWNNWRQSTDLEIVPLLHQVEAALADLPEPAEVEAMREKIAKLEDEAEANAWKIPPAMAQAKIDQLNASLDQTRAELAEARAVLAECVKHGHTNAAPNSLLGRSMKENEALRSELARKDEAIRAAVTRCDEYPYRDGPLQPIANSLRATLSPAALKPSVARQASGDPCPCEAKPEQAHPATVAAMFREWATIAKATDEETFLPALLRRAAEIEREGKL